MLTTGWKDILRPIRDGLGKLLPGKQPPAETPEERRKRKHRDALNGFTYFETFQEVDAWSVEDADPIACSNVPLQTRPPRSSTKASKANVLLIHDASGNYQDYEANQGVDLELEDKYTCTYLRYVETFVYFSHKLVCVPPATWTNTLHRNGVKSLGTFLIEPQTPSADRMLQSMRHHDGHQDTTTYCLASKLAKLAEVYGFDGWLVNIEKPFASDIWEASKLIAFLAQLRQDLEPHGQVVWYDALTSNNKVEYQNALTAKNVNFAQAAGSVLVNYTWSGELLVASLPLVDEHKLDRYNVYFGIDVWAQNKQHGLRRRVTYPPNNGGGTNTGVAVAKLAEHGLSAGIFAPAWSHEHFPLFGRHVERVMWDGGELFETVSCACGHGTHRTEEYMDHPISNYSYEYPPGTERYYFTQFTQAFRGIDGHPSLSRKVNSLHSQIGSQEPLPSLGDKSRTLEGRLTGDGLRRDRTVLEIYLHPKTKAPQEMASITLFDLDMVADNTLTCSIPFRLAASKPAAKRTTLEMAYTHGEINHQLGDCATGTDGLRRPELPVRCPCAQLSSSCRLLRIGIAVYQPAEEDTDAPLLIMESVRIAPPFRGKNNECIVISEVWVEQEGEGDEAHWRLQWDWHYVDGKDGWLRKGGDEALLTRLCGPFAYFEVTLNDEPMNDVYACEMVLDEKWSKRMEDGEEMAVTVRGFDLVGRELAFTEVFPKSGCTQYGSPEAG